MFKSYLSFLNEFEKRKINDKNYKNKEPHKLSIGDLLNILMVLPQSPFKKLKNDEKNRIIEYLSCIRNDYYHPWRFIKKEVTPTYTEIIQLKKGFDDLVACANMAPED